MNPTLNTAPIQSQLTHIEQQLNSALHCLNTGDSPALVQASAQLKAASLELLGLVQNDHSLGRHQQPNRQPHQQSQASQQKTQISQLAQRLLSLRENLIRRTAYVERALQVVMPEAQKKPTYLSAGPYASSAASTSFHL
jgi:hypothetical protein